MSSTLFFDYASTTPCIPSAVEALAKFSTEKFGNPSSSHLYGQEAHHAIREARSFFAQVFNTSPEQVLFTGSGSEADNLAIYGVALDTLSKNKNQHRSRVLCSSIEHAAVKKTIQSLSSFGIDVQLIPVDANGQIVLEKFSELLTPETLLVSIHQVNNILGSLLPIEELAQFAKSKVPGLIFHTDAVQAFGKVKIPSFPSKIDLLSISAHKIQGPKGIGALIVLNPSLLRSGLRPLIWGGGQEGGFRSGTQNAGLISGFYLASEILLRKQKEWLEWTTALRLKLMDSLIEKKLLAFDSNKNRSKGSPLHWNSPLDLNLTLPHIISLSAPGFPGGAWAKLLEDRHCLVSTGSACSSKKADPEDVLCALGYSDAIQTSAIRISFSTLNKTHDIDILSNAIAASLDQMARLL